MTTPAEALTLTARNLASMIHMQPLDAPKVQRKSLATWHRKTTEALESLTQPMPLPPLVEQTADRRSLDAYDEERLSEYNARLRAAATELLSALESLSDDATVEECWTCEGSGVKEGTHEDACHQCGGCGEVVRYQLWPDHVRMARAVIAKAKGYLVQ